MLRDGKIRRRETRMTRRLTIFTLARQADKTIEKEKR